MRQSNSPPPAGAHGGILGALSGLGWPVFIIDEILENAPKIANGIKEGAWGKVLLGLFIILGALLLSPFLWAFVVPTWLVWSRLSFDLIASLKVGLVGETVFLVVFVAWVVKKFTRDPWSRALTQARLEIGHSPNAAPGEVAERVRRALAEDERAGKFADDAARRVLAEKHPDWLPRKRRFRIRIHWPFRDDGGRDQELSCLQVPPRVINSIVKPRGRPDHGGLWNPMQKRERR